MVITDKLLYNRKAKFEAERLGAILMGDEQIELLKLRKKINSNRSLLKTNCWLANC